MINYWVVRFGNKPNVFCSLSQSKGMPYVVILFVSGYPAVYVARAGGGETV